MKKLVLIIMVFVFYLCSCDTEKYSVSITNNSSKNVSYIYDGNSDTLGMSKSKTYSVKAYTQPPEDIIDQNGIASIKMIYDTMEGNYSFNNAHYYSLTAKNDSAFDVTIIADNYIDDNGSVEFTIGANGKKTAKIYTSKPKFTSLVDYHIVIDWSITNNTMSVIIK